MSMCPVGTHPAKLTNYEISLNSKGTPQIVCAFQITVGDTDYMMSWFGYFTPNAKARTLETMMSVMDLWCEPSEIDEKLSQIAGIGKDSGLLNMEKDYAVVVEHEVYEGKARAKIKWVNNVGGGMKFESIAKQQAKSMFAGMNLAGDVAAFKAKNPGLKKKEDGFKAPF